jgi:hypothetical protein
MSENRFTDEAIEAEEDEPLASDSSDAEDNVIEDVSEQELKRIAREVGERES